VVVVEDGAVHFQDEYFWCNVEPFLAAFFNGLGYGIENGFSKLFGIQDANHILGGV